MRRARAKKDPSRSHKNILSSFHRGAAPTWLRFPIRFARPPMLSLPPSHLVCADLLPPRPPQRNASLCSRFTTDPSRVLSYLSLVPRTSSSPPSPPPSSLYLGLPPLSSPARFAAAETIVAVALVAVQPLPSDPEYIALRVASELLEARPTDRLACLRVRQSVCGASELLTLLLSRARNSH